MTRLLIASLALFWGSAALAFPVTVDSCGILLTFDAPPKRTVIHDPNMTEMTFALGFQPSIVEFAGINGWYKVGPEFSQAQGSIPNLHPRTRRLRTCSPLSPTFSLRVGMAAWRRVAT